MRVESPELAVDSVGNRFESPVPWDDEAVNEKKMRVAKSVPKQRRPKTQRAPLQVNPNMFEEDKE